ncbi:MAG: 2-succinyl-5-enolpyruvyl-6-hydroxy-3-cyclohexene-1-carboxylic-acid synthase [Oligoflexus sp.]|nr:2-succinyl-5-enolpyruvyl-6-hydroxy-3-cyclohexene-1-carboxylic-acid synthase [Oligoflexus sp.]
MAFLADQNWNLFASSILIDICQRFGSDTFFVSPGYRDAPFIAALQSRNDLTLVSCWDERAAAFQALGWAKARKKPAVLICTSGTAGANYLPAIIEAKTDHIPLFIITADRPFDLVFASAQQVIDQRDLFGKFVKRSLDFPAPSAAMNSKAWMSYTKMLLETSVSDRPGPVHLNLPFTAPLDPVLHEQRPSTLQLAEAEEAILRMRFGEGSRLVSKWNSPLVTEFVAEVQAVSHGLLLIGRLQSDEDKAFVREVRERLGWPVFADIGSGLKYESDMEIPDLNLPQSRAWIDSYYPDFVLHLGKRLVTRYFDDSLARWNHPLYWVLSDEEHIQDPYHQPQRRQFRPDFEQILRGLPTLPRRDQWKAPIARLQKALRSVLSPSFNFRDVAETTRSQCKEHLFLGNSTAIRAFDSWCFESDGQALDVVANRGVSGIEGLLATTIGLSLATGKLWTLVVGDIAMLHDLNSIISLAQSKARVIVVIVNNVGGRIFETLPVQKYPWVKDPLISTPHAFQFAGVAEMAGLPYQLCESQSTFGEAYASALSRAESCIIECSQEAEADLNYSRALSSQEINYE